MNRTKNIRTLLGTLCAVLVLVAFWLIYTGCFNSGATVKVRGAGKGTLAGQQVGSQQLSGGAVGGAMTGAVAGEDAGKEQTVFVSPDPAGVKTNTQQTGTGGTQGGGGGGGGGGGC